MGDNRLRARKARTTSRRLVFMCSKKARLWLAGGHLDKQADLVSLDLKHERYMVYTSSSNLPWMEMEILEAKKVFSAAFSICSKALMYGSMASMCLTAAGSSADVFCQLSLSAWIAHIISWKEDAVEWEGS